MASRESWPGAVVLVRQRHKQVALPARAAQECALPSPFRPWESRRCRAGPEPVRRSERYRRWNGNSSAMIFGDLTPARREAGERRSEDSVACGGIHDGTPSNGRETERFASLRGGSALPRFQFPTSHQRQPARTACTRTSSWRLFGCRENWPPPRRLRQVAINTAWSRLFRNQVRKAVRSFAFRR